VERLFWVLMVHQNLAGDTALHAAARAGNPRGVKVIVYRLFHGDELNVDYERRGLDPDSGGSVSRGLGIG
jgi:ankyrin repeat protein